MALTNSSTITCYRLPYESRNSSQRCGKKLPDINRDAGAPTRSVHGAAGSVLTKTLENPGFTEFEFPLCTCLLTGKIVACDVVRYARVARRGKRLGVADKSDLCGDTSTEQQISPVGGRAEAVDFALMMPIR